MELRPYQSKILADIRAAYNTAVKAPLLVSPTGSGKSAILGYMMERTKKRSLILVHREELLEQVSSSLRIPHGLITAKSKTTDHSIQIGMVQTVSRRLQRLPKFEWIISDECHLSVAATWTKVLRHYPDALQLGLSATPTRLDGKGLGTHFDKLILGPSISDLVDLRFLSPVKTFVPKVEMKKIRVLGGDYVMSEAANLFGSPQIVGDAVREYKRIAEGKSSIVFCCTRAHADSVATEFRDAGYEAYNVDGSMSTHERSQRIRDFRLGRIKILTNVELLTTGFDLPQLECEIMMRPTMSESLFLQQGGRIMRPYPGKTHAILLDMANNTSRHGLLTSEREWTLEGTTKEKRAVLGDSVRICLKCFSAQFSKVRQCEYCGEIPLLEERKIKEEDGELEELRETQKKIRRMEQGSAQTLQDLIRLGTARGYANPYGWAYRVFQGRKR